MEFPPPLGSVALHPSPLSLDPSPTPDPALGPALGPTPGPALGPGPDPAQLRQLILPTDKRNPSFSLYRMIDRQGRKIIQVYYGLELLEEVADEVTDPTFRSMIARLYNARLKLKSLVEVFALDPKTIRSWGEALKSRDPQRMSVMFFGADAGRKRTALIEAFVRVRLPGLLKLRTRNFRATLQSEIAQIFDIRLSGETLRILIAGMKPEVLPTNESAGESANEPTDEFTDEPTDELTDEPTEDPADEPTDELTNEPTDRSADQSAPPSAAKNDESSPPQNLLVPLPPFQSISPETPGPSSKDAPFF